MTAVPRIANRRARALFLAHHGLAHSPVGAPPLADIIDQLGFVQLDSINTVMRAHHMILKARRQSYRPPELNKLYAQRGLFEHWTHDASVIPMSSFPYWKLKCRRDAERLLSRWQTDRRAGFEENFTAVLEQIRKQGPCCSSDVGEGEARSSGGWWDWHPSKTALEYLWRSGQLSVTRRINFRKFYDLTDHVVPEQIRHIATSAQETIDWCCSGALRRLGFATSGEIAKFWDIVTVSEAKAWCAKALADGRIAEVDIADCTGQLRRAFAYPELLDVPMPDLPERVRILSPFDPALRDRIRAERLFGFSYRIEVFVPEPKRRYGYYVFPVLEGAKLIGRIDMKSHRDQAVLKVRAFWPETKTKISAARLARLEAEIERMAKFSGTPTVEYRPDWLRATAPS